MAWLTNWNRRKQITVNGSTAGAQSDFQMKLIVNQGSGTDSAGIVNLGGNVLTTFNDLRFTKSDGTTTLNYWIESVTGTSPSQTTTVWIKLAPSPDTIPTSPGTYNFYIYYNNISASIGSNGTNTFLFFDDFNDGVYTDKWTTAITGWSESGGVLSSDGSGIGWFGQTNDRGIYTSTYTMPPSYILEGKMRLNGSNHYIAVGEHNGISSGYNLQLRQDGGPQQLFIDVDGGSYATSNPSLLYNVWYAYKITKVGTTSITGTIPGYTATYTGTNIPTSTSLSFFTFTTTGSWDDVRVRKYASPEPTFSTVGTEELSITATNMNLNTNTCAGPCQIIAGVTWQNLGSSSVTFRPAILINGTTYAYASSDITIGPYPAEGSSTVTTPTLSIGTHTICPSPN